MNQTPQNPTRQSESIYPHFFVRVILATIPNFLGALKIPLDAEFGKRTRAN
jgi:hypothetical protein